MRIVVKVGTHAIAKKTGRPDYRALRRLVKQLCAAVGQARFIYEYEKLFAEQGIQLVTSGLVPIVNENDVVASGDRAFEGSPRIRASRNIIRHDQERSNTSHHAIRLV